MSARSRIIVIRASAGIVLLVFWTGCATPREVRILSEKTAANVGVISGQLARLSASSRNLAEFRASNIAELHAQNARLRAAYQYDIALTEMSGDAGRLEVIPDIEKWGERVRAIFAAAEGAEQRRREEILANHEVLDTKAKALGGIAQSLAELAKEEGWKDRARFLAGYAKELGKESKKQLEESDEAKQAAKNLLGSPEGENK